MDDFSKMLEDMKATWTVMTPEQEAERVKAEEEHRAREEARMAARRQRAIDELTPVAHRWARPDAIELGQRVKLADPAVWASNPAGTTFVLFHGPSGSGKTSLAAAALRGLVLSGKLLGSDSYFVTAYRLSVARAQSKLGQGEPEEVERAMECRHLLIDDLGQEQAVPTSAIVDVVFERYDRQATTWLTTGLSREQLVQRYGDGFVRRLVDRSTLVRLGVR
jgi:DNA replication protein DnaC